MFIIADGKAYLQTDKGYVGVEIYSDKVLSVGGRAKKTVKGKAMSLKTIRLKFQVTEDNPLLFDKTKKVEDNVDEQE